MKYIDFVVQSVLFVAAVVIMLSAWYVGEKHWGASVLTVQMWLGPWQLASGLLSMLITSPAKRRKALYLGLCALYLTTLAVFPLEGVAQLIYLTIPAWALATFYYVITCKLVFARKHDGHFLPHLSF